MSSTQQRYQPSFRARLRWQKAFSLSKRMVRRRHLRHLLVPVVKAYAVHVIETLVTAALLWHVEGDNLCRQAADVFEQQADSGIFNCYTGAVYMSGLITHRVGYGDVLMVTTAGRIVAMFGCTVGILNTTVLSIRTADLLDYLMKSPKNFILRALGPSKEHAAYSLLYLLLVLAVHAINAVILAFQRYEDGNSMTITDIIWYTWATASTVGFGDHTVMSIPNLSLFSFCVQYLFLVSGMILFEATLARAILATFQLKH